MKKYSFTSILLIVVLIGCNDKHNSKKEIETTNKLIYNETFPSLDSLDISAKIYEISTESPVIVLCHQAWFNKFEYEGIAQKLNDKGFNCIAIDQRSGGRIANMVNETKLRAIEKNKPTEYLDAEQDIIAAVNYAFHKYNRPVILWGSSYSSTLALYIGIENDKVGAVVSFSPGNYLAEQKGSLIEKLSDFDKPMFITSSKKEIPDIKELLTEMKLNEGQIFFEPNGDGYHGSRALWEHQPGGEEYWQAVVNFLEQLK